MSRNPSLNIRSPRIANYSSNPTRRPDSRTSIDQKVSPRLNEYYTKSTSISKVSTGQSYVVSRRSSFNDVVSPAQSPLGNLNIFSVLSELLQNQTTFVEAYKKKLEDAKSKVATSFHHFKAEISMALEQQQMAICQSLNKKYKSFISVFQDTKNMIHQLYDEKMRYSETMRKMFQQMCSHQNNFLKSYNNQNTLDSIRQENFQSIMSKKYEAFFESKKEDFEELAERRRSIEQMLTSDIFDYSQNLMRLKQLKKDFKDKLVMVYSTDSHFC